MNHVKSFVKGERGKSRMKKIDKDPAWEEVEEAERVAEVGVKNVKEVKNGREIVEVATA